MKPTKMKVILLTLFVFALLLPCSSTMIGQEFSAGAKLVRATPFVFAEARFWLFSVQVGAGFSSQAGEDPANGYQESPVEVSLGGKAYPIQLMNLSSYVGFSTSYSGNGRYNQSRTFGGAEFSFRNLGLPLTAFAGGDLIFTEREGIVSGWHLGVKYTF